MITVDTNILSVDYGVIVQQVNCQGVMGSGVAAQLRFAWPQIFIDYEKVCKETPNPEDRLGKFCLTNVQPINKPEEPNLYVSSVFGQLRYGSDGAKYTSYDALDKSLGDLKTSLGPAAMILPFHFPMIGSGLGGGKWNIVKEIITSHFGSEWYFHDFKKVS